MSAPVRCAAWSAAAEVDPIGSAPSNRGLLLVEWALPWPADINEVDALEPLRHAVVGTGVRLQAVVPERAGMATITWYRPADWPGGFAGIERAVPATDAVEAAIDLLRSARGEPCTVRDVLVCTHGRRDVCCGTTGTVLHRDLVAALAGRADLRVRRTSHLGGHRYAPTVLVMPDGTSWARADVASMLWVLDRVEPADSVLDRYRGNIGLPTPPLQALERVAIAEHGWSVLDAARAGTTLGGGLVRLDVQHDGAWIGSWTAVAREGRVLPVPVCGAPIEAARKCETELLLTDIRCTTVRSASLANAPDGPEIAELVTEEEQPCRSN